MPSSKIQTSSLTEVLKGKVVVSDTSSLLIAGTFLLENLSDCKVVIPAVVVRELEEKRTHATLGFLAREWLRLIENYRITDSSKLKAGIELEEHPGIRIQIEPNHSNQESLPKHLQNGSNDSTILAVAVNLKKEGNDVVLLSNDMPMRLHASLELELDAYEYSSTRNLKKPFQGRFILDVKNEDVDAFGLYSDGVDDELRDYVLANLSEDAPNTSFVEFTIEGEPAKASVLVSNGKVTKVGHKNKAMKVTGKTLEQNVLLELLTASPEELPVVSVGGGAGTGKTLLTIAAALSELKAGTYEKIMVFRSLHELGQGQEMGFLPGSVDEKMGPWAGAIFDAIDTLGRLEKPLPKNATHSHREKQKEEAKKLKEMVEIAPITYLRGRSLAHTFMILEEAQNFSRSEILNILSRAGQGTKIVLTADSAQVDNRFLKSGKDADIWSVIDSLKDQDIFAHITLTKTERSRVAEIAAGILEHD